MKVIIYTDGSSKGNPGPGGWGAVIFRGEEVKELGGRTEKTTNNRMEMTAALEALRPLPNGIAVEINTDSGYLLNGITKWVYGWQANDWKTKEKGEVLNRDIWEELVGEVSKREVEWKKVIGHSGHALNERCDELATSFALGKKMDLYSGPKSGYKINSEAKIFNKTGKSGRAYSYVSKSGGIIQTHQTWSECEKRVKGARGARYRKALSLEEEKEIIALFQSD